MIWEPISSLLRTKNAYRSSSLLISYFTIYNFLDENTKSYYSLFCSVVRSPSVLNPVNILNSRLTIKFEQSCYAKRNICVSFTAVALFGVIFKNGFEHNWFLVSVCIWLVWVSSQINTLIFCLAVCSRIQRGSFLRTHSDDTQRRWQLQQCKSAAVAIRGKVRGTGDVAIKTALWNLWQVILIDV